MVFKSIAPPPSETISSELWPAGESEYLLVTTTLSLLPVNLRGFNES